ncbi:hypothetical protein HMPREF1544_07502 [Mucor circinelloides 1006PhL]|uniref:Uncharacterized protein n=1 Tax=Mucor circinelloides f. circinelloides (strain 1006PhL) TaxID=1220926 RepID=S2J6H5_MUCC1|nr:hypothetical protein HMPREF1544_07502 [Mucor circinelloides 1006PhL]
MRSWGFRKKNLCKAIYYYDGHEREDVVLYRNQWSKRMMDRKPYMDEFLRNEEATWIVKAVLPSEQRLVHITHDECTYFANDGKSKLWLLDGTEEPPRLPKGTGASTMIP